MDAITIFSSLVLFMGFWIYFRNSEKKKLINEIPGPETYPLIGNLLEMLVPREEFLTTITKNFEKYGSIHRTWVGPTAVVHLREPDLIEPILRSSKLLRKGNVYKFLEPWLGTGLLTGYGQKWFNHRKMITPTFHFTILDTFLDVFSEQSEILVKKLEEKAKTKEEFDAYSFITFAALDIICETAMGTIIHAQSKQQSLYINSISKLATVTLLRGMKIWLRPNFIFYRTELGKEYAEKLKIVHGFTEEVIQERKKIQKSNDKNSNNQNLNEFGIKKRQAFLDLLLNESEKSEGSKLNDVELREEVDTFMFAGHDTTTAGICWAIYLLGHNPKIQEEVFDELSGMFSDDSKRVPTMKDLNEMKLLERVTKESLRLYPSVPLISRNMEEDVKIGKYSLPKGTITAIHIYHLHRNPEFYPDPEKFDPDRFLPDNIQKRHPYSYIPFSAGPRNCIGQKFALLEMKVMLSTLIRNYRFESVEKREDMVLMSEVVLRPKFGIKLKISKRN